MRKDGLVLPVKENVYFQDLSDEAVEESVRETERIISEAAKDKQPNISPRG